MDFEDLREELLRPRWAKQPRPLVRTLVTYIRQEETCLEDMGVEGYPESEQDFQRFCIRVLRDALDKAFHGREPV